MESGTWSLIEYWMEDRDEQRKERERKEREREREAGFAMQITEIEEKRKDFNM